MLGGASPATTIVDQLEEDTSLFIQELPAFMGEGSGTNGDKIGASASEIDRYSRRSRKRPPREFEKVVVTRAGRLRE